MPALDDILRQKLALLEAKGLKRGPRAASRSTGAKLERGGKTLISFSCNDYLGLSQHLDVIRAGIDALQTYGAGAGASRLVTGEHPLYGELEKELSKAKSTEAACVFGSGYLANMGTIPALVGAGDLILADKFSHACMLDGARLSGATVMRFAHNNMEHCKMLLEANRAEHQQCLIITETVFSMDGDRAPLDELKALAATYDAWLMSDDAHGLGFTQSPADIQMGTLSKAAGSYGGYVGGSAALVDYLKSAARSLVYSTALPPATIACSLAALRIIAADKTLAQKPLENARHFTKALGLADAQSAIVPLILKENELVLKASAYLEEQGYLVAAIRPPTVPENTARLRFAFSAMHEKSDIEKLAKIIWEQGWV